LREWHSWDFWVRGLSYRASWRGLGELFDEFFR
jgi:hypothetical protein